MSAARPVAANECAPPTRARIALLSNPKSTGNIAQLPRIRAFCAEHPDVFHYEVEAADQIGEAMRTIARIKPTVLAINGGDGTVQAALTELHNGDHFADGLPPVAVLPSGKTNLIALDLGAQGDPVDALRRLIDLARADLAPHLVARELIALSGGEGGSKPVIGMFLGGAGLADVMMYCRERIYPLGLPNGISHVITGFAVLLRQVFGWRASFLPPDPSELSISVRREGAITGRFALLFVTTLEKLLLSSEFGSNGKGALKFVAVEQRPVSLLRAFAASLGGRLGRTKMRGVHVEEADEIAIEGDRSQVILDGETFRAGLGMPILLRPATPLSFVRIAA
ncbi:acylglycerol kinase family protein [Sphingomonas sp. LY29]|uniref:diacylglycerol/lipid kinase family protein n=1 Tax=Sphingomonas sp. LY29 TaxID=3095341 RepID=UPI002D78B54F|nr:acylglycerol kinase family protein [Sphingomonas sp. LY29]WRP27058.1 acylglycerol kinase family protein [Sphingomonas sp. LY29]